LAPVGEWRSQIPRSKGKRAKSRKRKHEIDGNAKVEAVTAEAARIPAPLIHYHVTVGFNTTVRALEMQVAPAESTLSPVVAVFFTQSTDSIQYAHLPVLAAQSKPPVALIPLQSGAEERLCIAWGIARVGMIGIRTDAPGASALLSVISEVQAVEVPFLGQARKGQWLGVKIDGSMAVE
jgi:hypothetical protein